MPAVGQNFCHKKLGSLKLNYMFARPLTLIGFSGILEQLISVIFFRVRLFTSLIGYLSTANDQMTELPSHIRTAN